MGKGKPKYLPPYNVHRALTGLVHLVSNVLTDTQYDEEHDCGKPKCAIEKSTRRIREVFGLAEGAARALHDGRLRVTLDCTTGHIQGPEALRLNDGVCPLRMENHQHGWFIFLPEEVPEFTEEGWYDFPVLHRVVVFALGLGCGFINFDVDGAHHAELPEFEW